MPAAAAASAAPLAVSLPSSSLCTSPAPAHVVYNVHVVLPVRAWSVPRRYSAFVALHAALQSLLSATELPPLPPRHVARHAVMTGLSRLGLGAAVPLHAGPDEDEAARERRVALQRCLRGLLLLVSERSHTDAAVAQLADFLEMAPRDLPALAARVRDEDAPPKPVPSPTTTAAPAAPSAPTPAPGGFTRAFGSPKSSGSGPVQETAATRGLSAQGLLDAQQASMAAQDAQLGDLAAVLRRQRTLASAMNAELAQQNELLESFGGELGDVQRKMTAAQGQMKQLR